MSKKKLPRQTYKLTLKQGFEIIAEGELEVPERYLTRRFEDDLDGWDNDGSPTEEQVAESIENAMKNTDEKMFAMERKVNKKGDLRLHVFRVSTTKKEKKGKN